VLLQVIPSKSLPVFPEASALHLQRKRKADAVDDHSDHREAKRAHSLYRTSIAAPLRRARRSLLCMSKVGLPALIWLVMTAALVPMKPYPVIFPAATLLHHDTRSVLLPCKCASFWNPHWESLLSLRCVADNSSCQHPVSAASLLQLLVLRSVDGKHNHRCLLLLTQHQTMLRRPRRDSCTGLHHPFWRRCWSRLSQLQSLQM